VHPGLPGSVSVTYVWSDLFEFSERVTVPLDADGTATITVTPPRSGPLWFDAFTSTEAGYRSGWGEAVIDVASNQPQVTSAEYPAGQTSGGVGIPGTFVFSSPAPGVVSYTYQFSDQPPATVPAGPDGTASVVFTPTHTYVNFVTVTSTFADGTTSESGGYTFYVAYMYPQVSCDNNGDWLRPGQQVRCTLTPVQAGVVSYGYVLNSGPETTLPAGEDGTAVLDFTVPADQQSGSYLPLRLWSVNGAGTRSDEYITSFYVFAPGGA
jgi:hypothetical protein